MLVILLAVLGGVLTTLSMVVSSSLGKKIGLIQSTIIHYIGGLIGGIFILIGMGSVSVPSIIDMSRMPLYIFFGGIMGVMVVYASNVVIPKIPVVYSTLLMFSGQMLCAIVIDAIVMGDFSWKKLLGVNKTTLKYSFFLGCALVVVYIGATFGVKYTTLSIFIPTLLFYSFTYL